MNLSFPQMSETTTATEVRLKNIFTFHFELYRQFVPQDILAIFSPCKPPPQQILSKMNIAVKIKAKT